MHRSSFRFVALASALLWPTVVLAQPDEAAPPEDARAYAVGFEAGSFILERIRTDGVEMDIDALLLGLEDALRESPARLNEARMRMLLQRLEDEVRGREAEALLQSDPVFRALADENRRQGDAFRAGFAQEEGVVTLENGLQYRVLTPGAGAPPAETDTITVSFEAELVDGTEFAEGRRISIVVSDLNEGARQALLLMAPGARWLVAIPPELAFGAAGRAPDVGPNETILADIELHSIEGRP